MSVQTQQFRVVGVNSLTGQDVSVVIDAATKAAAEVKAEQMQIETTHIVRLKQDTPTAPDEHELFSSQAAEALAGKRTHKLIEEVVPPEEPKPVAMIPAASVRPMEHSIVAAITRPSYAAPLTHRETTAAQVSGVRAFGLVLLILLGMSAGAYFVLVHQPNRVSAQDHDLIFGQDLFSDVLEPAVAQIPDRDSLRDAFNQRAAAKQDSDPAGPPIAVEQQLHIRPPASISGGPEAAKTLSLQSVVTTHKGRFAIINGKLYEEGGSIGSAKLVSVADDWVLIERDGKQFTLKIQTSAKP